MMKLLPSQPDNHRTVDCAEPMPRDEIEERRLSGWVHVRTNRRISRRGHAYLQYEFERHQVGVGRMRA
jgi:hypothetical protein